MSSVRFKETWLQYQDAFLKFVGLRAYNTAPRTADPYNIYAYGGDADDRRALRAALFIALLFHLLIFVVRFAAGDIVFQPDQKNIVTLRPLAGPPKRAGGGKPKQPKKIEVPKPKPKPIPFPDPTPDDPEPLYEVVLDPTPAIIAQIGAEFHIGEITGPPGSGGAGSGSGAGRGPGGPEDGVFDVGGGVRPPVPLVQPLPLYTEQARKARVEGLVVLQAIVRKDGTVDGFKVIRGLGYGLDESAINTIATKWRFKPGTYNGQPVDVRANIEVSFRLY